MPFALTTQSLSKSFGRQVAVDDLSVRVPVRSIYGFLGANGAGKTTTLRLMLGLLRPDRGAIRLFGEEVRRGGARGVGALIEAPSLYPHLTGRENLDISRRLLRLRQSEIDRVLDLVDLRAGGERRVGTYSLGMRQRLAIARALLGKPRLLILDEPTNGLDPEGIVDMRALVRRLPDAEGTTLIISSHLLGEVEQVVTHAAMIHRGRLLMEDSLPQLLSGPGTLEIETGNPVASAALLGKAGFIVEPVRESRLSVGTQAGTPPDPNAIARLLVEAGHELRHLARERPSLERLYHHQLALAA
jgi:ABC-type multidrug transport system ATPase subunit